MYNILKILQLDNPKVSFPTIGHDPWLLNVVLGETKESITEKLEIVKQKTTKKSRGGTLP